MSDVSKEEVKQFFHRKIKPKLPALEQKRAAALRNVFLVFVVLALTSGLLLIKGVDFQFVLAGAAVLFCLAFVYLQKSYIKEFKQEVISVALQLIIPKSSYEPESLISDSLYRQSQLFRTDYTSYKGEDHVVGKISGMAVEFSELRVTKTTGSGKNKKTITLFNGIFFAFKLSQSLRQKTLITYDYSEILLGKLIGRGLQKMNVRDGFKLVQLESPEFEKVFAVQSNDQIAARRLLTPSTMKSLYDFRIQNAKAMAMLSISIINDRLFIAIEGHGNFFEPKLFGDIISMHEIREIYDLVNLVSLLNEELGVSEAA